MARWLGWQYPSGARRPRRGNGSVEDVVSHLPKTKAALATGAYELASRGQARLESLPKHRTGRSRVKVTKRDLDYVVVLEEGEHGKGGAVGIEARHNILGGAVAGMRII